MVNLLDDPDCPKVGRHRELEKAEIKKSEEAVQRVITAVKNFTNPFSISDKDRLYSLASGAPVRMDVEQDLLQAAAKGMVAKTDFITRLQSGEPGSFFDPIKRLLAETEDNGGLQQEGHAHILTRKGPPVPGAKRPRVSASRQVTATRRTIGLGQTHDGWCCTSIMLQRWDTRTLWSEPRTRTSLSFFSTTLKPSS
ncbi:hypothetical protein V1264_008789 [Littorina saxatilis]|uniref:Uncharacterized protein n=1 Tax=Littorina saxatilis TaxID=31220 RepID=A0AAN9AV58_9CAEN